MKIAKIGPVVVLSLLSACSLIRLDPVVSEKRHVVAAADPTKTVSLEEPMVWMNAPAHRATKGVRLPQGVYALEAEDEEYWYFRAPGSIEMRVYRHGQSPEGPDVPGGIALAKSSWLTSAAVYVRLADEETRMLVMKLGFEFLQMRGKQWDQSF